MKDLLKQAALDNIWHNPMLTSREIARFSVVPKYFIPGSLLDVGCRTADLQRFLSNNDVIYYGLDIVDYYGKFVKKFFLCDISKEKIPVPDNFFNNIHIGEVLEHISNFFFAFQEIHRVLKPGGRVVLTVPNNFNLIQAISVIYFKRYKKKKLDVKSVEKFDTHIHSFHEVDLLKICQLIGLKPIYCDRFYNKLIDFRLPEMNIFKCFATFILYVAEK